MARDGWEFVWRKGIVLKKLGRKRMRRLGGYCNPLRSSSFSIPNQPHIRSVAMVTIKGAKKKIAIALCSHSGAFFFRVQIEIKNMGRMHLAS